MTFFNTKKNHFKIEFPQLRSSGRTEFQTQAAAAPRRVGVHFERSPSKRFASRKQQVRLERARHEQRQQRELQIPAAVESEAVVLQDVLERPRPSAVGEEVVPGEWIDMMHPMIVVSSSLSSYLNFL